MTGGWFSPGASPSGRPGRLGPEAAYGDHFLVTLQGRFVAVGLVIGGVALIGVVTASFAA